MKTHSLQASKHTKGESLLTEWIDLDGAAPQDREWLTAHAEIDPPNVSLLLDAMPRSRCVHTDAGILVTFVSPEDANADGQELHWRTGLDPVDDLT